MLCPPTSARGSAAGQHDVGGSQCCDMPGACVSQGRQVDAFEQRLARTKQDRCDGDMKFINELLPKILPDCRRSSPDPDVLSAGGIACPLKRGVDAIGHEMKSGASLHHEWRAGMMGEHENLRMVNRVLAPPSPP